MPRGKKPKSSESEGEKPNPARRGRGERQGYVNGLPVDPEILPGTSWSDFDRDGRGKMRTGGFGSAKRLG